MPDLETFDPRDSRFKSPYGAVPSGTKVAFNLRPLRAEGFSRGRLIAALEQRDNQHLEIELAWTSTDFDRDVFSGELDTGDYVGLIWYTLILEGMDGRTRELGTYQLTVYDGSETVPDWYGQGMCYQIFPDRFHRTEIPDPTGLVGGRWVHEKWDDEPAYRPNEHGEIRNRDFFGGNFAGIIEKLDYLQKLGDRKSVV